MGRIFDDVNVFCRGMVVTALRVLTASAVATVKSSLS